MYYHALCYVPGGGNYWKTNTDLAIILNDLVIPFINKQVIPTNMEGGRAILNLGLISTIQLFKSEEVIKEPENRKEVVSILKSPEFKNKECTQEIIDLALLNRSSADSKSLIQTVLGPTKRQIFVIMKFKDKVLDSAYEGVIKPIIKKFKYKPLRIDEIQDSGKINEQILEEIGRSEVILADLTGERPNCYYEAGFAHAIGKEMIFTIRKGAPIHFDLYTYRFIEWETEEDLRKKLNERLKAISSGKNAKTGID